VILFEEQSAERFYEPGVLVPARYTTGAVSSAVPRGVGRALRYAGGSAPARRPTHRLTFLNWGKH